MRELDEQQPMSRSVTLVLDHKHIPDALRPISRMLRTHNYDKVSFGYLRRLFNTPPQTHLHAEHFSRKLRVGTSAAKTSLATDPVFRARKDRVYLDHTYLWAFLYAFLCDCRTSGSSVFGLLSEEQCMALAKAHGLIGSSVDDLSVPVKKALGEMAETSDHPKLLLDLYGIVADWLLKHQTYAPFRARLARIIDKEISLTELEIAFDGMSRQRDREHWLRKISRHTQNYRDCASLDLVLSTLTRDGIGAMFRQL